MGMGLIFMAGMTTGGSDILGYVLQKKRPQLSIGRALMAVDGVILLMSIYVFGNIDAALFGLVSLFATTKGYRQRDLWWRRQHYGHGGNQKAA